MAGYSGTPLVKKLGIKPGATVAVLDAPADFAATLGALPEGARCEATLGEERAVIVWFTRDAAALAARLPALKAALDWQGGLWIAWPKKASKVSTDITEDVVRALALAAGLVDNKVCAIDAVWSGLRLVYRKADRPSPRRR
ncbi:MAG: DUF3052 family protein [Myxococcales bacterium]|nr:DUF3052 family protein [Myxococcales bacterium]